MAKYLMVYDEALCNNDKVLLSTCLRAGSDKNPHRHFVTFQFETDEDGNVRKSAVSNGFHYKEIVTIVQEAAAAGLITQVPEDVEKRLIDECKEACITLAREEDTNGIKYFVDVRNSKKQYLKMVKQFPDTPEGYKDAHSLMIEAATQYNLPYNDLVFEALNKKS